MRAFIIALFCGLLTGCLFDGGSDTIVDDYEVIWIDVDENRTLNKQEGLVPAYVFAAGHDSKYIYAKQHPLIPDSPEIIDKKITNYYLIERTKNSFQDKPKYGPLTQLQFDSICSKLGIKNVEFDMVYPTNLNFN